MEHKCDCSKCYSGSEAVRTVDKLAMRHDHTHRCDFHRESVEEPAFVRDATGVGAMVCRGLHVEIEQELPDTFTNWMRASENTSVLIPDTGGDEFIFALNAYDLSDMDPGAADLGGLYRTKQVLESYVRVTFAFSDNVPYRVFLGPKLSTASAGSENYMQRLPLYKTGYVDRQSGTRSIWHHLTVDKLTGIDVMDRAAWQWSYPDSAPSKLYQWVLQVYNDTEDATADPIEIHTQIWYRIKWSQPFCLLNPALGVKDKKYRIHGKEVSREEYRAILYPEEKHDMVPSMAAPSVSAMSAMSIRKR